MWPLIRSQISRRPLFAIMAGQMLFWSIWPALFFATPPLDVVENMFWGPQWELGYYKHPPLQAWLTQLAVMIGGQSFVYVVAQACVLITYAGIYWAGLILQGRSLGLWAVALSALGFYATIPTVELNANVVSMPFWSLSLALGLRLTKHADGWAWYGLALSFAGALLAKYVAIFLAVTLAFLLVVAPISRRSLQTFHPYVALMMALVILAPHFWWLWANDFAPITYAQERAKLMAGWDIIIRPLKFLLAQILDFILPILICLPAIWAGRNTQLPGWRMWLVAMGPIFFLAIYAIITLGAPKDMWGGPATVMATLPLAYYLSHHGTNIIKTWTARAVALVMLILPLGLGLASMASIFTDRPMRTAWPSEEMAEHILQELGAEDAKNITHLVGPTWEMGIIYIHWPHDVLPVVHGDLGINPWAKESWDGGRRLYLWSGAKDPALAQLAFDLEGRFPFESKNSDGLYWGLTPAVAPGKNP